MSSGARSVFERARLQRAETLGFAKIRVRARLQSCRCTFDFFRAERTLVREDWELMPKEGRAWGARKTTQWPERRRLRTSVHCAPRRMRKLCLRCEGQHVRALPPECAGRGKTLAAHGSRRRQASSSRRNDDRLRRGNMQEAAAAPKRAAALPRSSASPAAAGSTGSVACGLPILQHHTSL